MILQHVLSTRRLVLAAAGALAFCVAATGAAAATPAGSAAVDHDTLIVIGSNGSEQLALRLAAGDQNALEVDFGDDGSAERSFDRGTFSRVVVFLRSGRDQFRVDQTNGAFADEQLTIVGGSGDDVLLGGDGNETIFGGSGRDNVDGNRGVDVAYLGSGRDSFQWDPGDGSDVVDGASGFDTLIFNGADGAETMSLAANGYDAVFLRDPGAIRMDMVDVEALDLATLGGVDTITIGDMTGTDVRFADVDLSAAGVGDGSPDVVTVQGSEQGDRIDVEREGLAVEIDGLAAKTRVSGGETIDRLQVNGGGGTDDVDVDDDVRDLLEVSVDLGADDL